MPYYCDHANRIHTSTPSLLARLLIKYFCHRNRYHSTCRRIACHVYSADYLIITPLGLLNMDNMSASFSA